MFILLRSALVGKLAPRRGFLLLSEINSVLCYLIQNLVYSLKMDGLIAGTVPYPVIALNWGLLISDPRTVSRDSSSSYTASSLCSAWQNGVGVVGLSLFHLMRSESFFIVVSSGFDIHELVSRLTWLLDFSSNYWIFFLVLKVPERLLIYREKLLWVLVCRRLLVSF